MWLSNFTVRNCRIIESATIELSPNINFIVGNNGSGKTSLLEALSILSFGRSFRTSRISDVIQYNKASAISSAMVHSETHKEQRIGIEKSSSKTTIRLNKKNIRSQAELSKIVPFSIIHPLSHQLITGASSARRSFLDWISFYQHPEFHSLWKRYQILLKQRNAALKDPKLFYAIEHLTIEMCKLQAPIHEIRESSLEQLIATLHRSTPAALHQFIPDVTLNSGIPSDIELDTETLVRFYHSKLRNEKLRGRTQKGIHSADLKIALESKPAASSASRGQTKILSMLLLLSQNITINQHGIIAIDDLSAEIDSENHPKLMEYILSLGRQLFITSTTKPDTSSTGSKYAMFHVEHGVVSG